VGYQHIENVYKNQTIFLFKECYALEKIHGTSAHIKWSQKDQKLIFFSGGEDYYKFISLFNQKELEEKFIKRAEERNSQNSITVFGEAYGGRQQGMSHTYGPNTKFIGFDVKIGNIWLDVPRAEKFCNAFGIEFVHYVRIPATVEEIDKQRDAFSVQAVRNGMGDGHLREGVVLRPIVEFVHQGENGGRIIAKHKSDKFKETTTTRKIVDPEQWKILEKANEIADEWCTHNRLTHVLDKIQEHSMEKMRIIIDAMIEDIMREASGEIVVGSKDVFKAIAKKTVSLYKEFLKNA
jgi:Rnl2 family RNA ligase